jgi:hypothetical protein
MIARLDCQEPGPSPGRQEGAEPDQTAKRRDLNQAATRRLSQLRLPRDERVISGRARSGSHELVEGERAGGAGSGGALAAKEMKPGETRF